MYLIISYLEGPFLVVLPQIAVVFQNQIKSRQDSQ